MPINDELDEQVDLDTWERKVFEKHGVPEGLRMSIMGQESGGNVNAVSPTNVRGKWQVTKATAKQYGLNRDDPWEQPIAAAKYLREGYDLAKKRNPNFSEREAWLASAGHYYGGPGAFDQGGNLSSKSLDGLSTPAKYAEGIARRWSDWERQSQQPAAQLQPQATASQTGRQKVTSPGSVTPRPQGIAPNRPPSPMAGANNPFSLSAPTGFQIAADQAAQRTAGLQTRAPNAEERDFQSRSPLGKIGYDIKTGYRQAQNALANQLYGVGEVVNGITGGDLRPLKEQAAGIIGGLDKGVEMLAGGRPAPETAFNLRQNQLAQERRRANDPYWAGSEESARRDEARAQANPSLSGKVVRGITQGAVSTAPILATGAVGGTPAILAATAATQDYTRPEEAALNIASTALPIKAGQAISPLAAKVAQKGAQNVAGQELIRRGIEAAAGGATNAVQYGAVQKLRGEQIDPEEMIAQGVTGAALGTAMAPSRRQLGMTVPQKPYSRTQALRQPMSIIDANEFTAPQPNEPPRPVRFGQRGTPAPAAEAPGTAPLAEPTAPANDPQAVRRAFRLEADDAKNLMAQFEGEGDYEKAWAEADAAHNALRRLRRELGRSKSPEDVSNISALDREISYAAQARKEYGARLSPVAKEKAKQGRAAEAAQRKAQESAPTAAARPTDPNAVRDTVPLVESRQPIQATPEQAITEDLPPAPAGRRVRVGDEEVDLSPEQAARWAEEVEKPLQESDARYKRGMQSRNAAVRNAAESRRKAEAMRIAAKKREIADRLTGKERVAAGQRAPIAKQPPTPNVEAIQRRVVENWGGPEGLAMEYTDEGIKNILGIPPEASLRPLIDAGIIRPSRQEDGRGYEFNDEIQGGFKRVTPQSPRIPTGPIQEPTNRISGTEYEGGVMNRYSRPLEGAPIETPDLVTANSQQPGVSARPTKRMTVRDYAETVDMPVEDKAALDRALRSEQAENPRAYGDVTRPGEPGSGGVSFSPYNDLVSNNRAKVNQLFGLDLNSPEAAQIIGDLEGFAANRDIEPRHVENLLNYIKNDQMEAARREDGGDDIQPPTGPLAPNDPRLNPPTEGLTPRPKVSAAGAKTEIATPKFSLQEWMRDAEDVGDRIKDSDTITLQQARTAISDRIAMLEEERAVRLKNKDFPIQEVQDALKSDTTLQYMIVQELSDRGDYGPGVPPERAAQERANRGLVDILPVSRKKAAKEGQLPESTPEPAPIPAGEGKTTRPNTADLNAALAPETGPSIEEIRAAEDARIAKLSNTELEEALYAAEDRRNKAIRGEATEAERVEAANEVRALSRNRANRVKEGQKATREARKAGKAEPADVMPALSKRTPRQGQAKPASVEAGTVRSPLDQDVTILDDATLDKRIRDAERILNVPDLDPARREKVKAFRDRAIIEKDKRQKQPNAEVEAITRAARERQQSASDDMRGLRPTEEDWMTSEEKQIVQDANQGRMQSITQEAAKIRVAEKRAARRVDQEKGPRGAKEEGATEAARTKEPWQMTKAEYEQAVFSGNVDFPLLGMRGAAGETIGKLVRSYHQTSDAQNKEIARKDILSRLEGRHRGVVVIAKFKEGKPVPPEVLADYPDLVATKKTTVDVTQIPVAADGDLDATSRDIETRFREYLANNFDEAVARYEKKFGKEINTDNARELSADYAASDEARSRYSPAVHEPSSWFAKELYKRMLKEKPKKGEKPVVLFTAGGTGAGKTSTLASSAKLNQAVDQSQIIMDGNLNNAKKAIQKIDQALAAGKRVQIAAVYRDPVEAWRNGVLPRAEKRGRAVPIDIHVQTHSEMLDSLIGIAEHYENNPRVEIHFIDNTHGKDRAVDSTVDIFQAIDDTEMLRKQLETELKEAHEKGEISKRVYEGTLASSGHSETAKNERAESPIVQPGRGSGRKPELVGSERRPAGPPDTAERAGSGSAESGGPGAEVRGSIRIARGDESSLTVPRSNQKHAIQYEIRELADIQPSHDPFTFQKNPKYRLTNDRDYSTPANRIDVEEATKAGAFEPRLILTDDPTATNGPPIIHEDGNVLGGNSRTMMLGRVYKNHPADGAAYRKELERRAAMFGIDPAEVKNFQQPILVRRVVTPKGGTQKLITDLNIQPGKALTSTEAASARAKSLPAQTMQFLADRLAAEGADGTLAQALEGRKGIDVLNRLIEDDVIPRGERNRYLSDQNTLTPTAKSEIEAMLLGRVFRDADQMKAAAPEMRNRLARIAPHVAKMAGTEWDITPLLPNAIEAAATSRNQKIDVEMLNQRGFLFGEGVKYSPQELAIADRILRDGPRQLENTFRRYAANFDSAQQGASLFGDAMSPQEGFADAFPGVAEPTKPQFVADAEAPSATAAAKTAVTEAGKGLDSALKGLGELFGGKNKLSAGFTFDEDTYAAAKPHFQEAYTHFKGAVESAADAGRALVNELRSRGFGADVIRRMKPYIDRFAREMGGVKREQVRGREIGAKLGKSIGRDILDDPAIFDDHPTRADLEKYVADRLNSDEMVERLTKLGRQQVDEAEYLRLVDLDGLWALNRKIDAIYKAAEKAGQPEDRAQIKALYREYAQGVEKILTSPDSSLTEQLAAQQVRKNILPELGDVNMSTIDEFSSKADLKDWLLPSYEDNPAILRYMRRRVDREALLDAALNTPSVRAAESNARQQQRATELSGMRSRRQELADLRERVPAEDRGLFDREIARIDERVAGLEGEAKPKFVAEAEARLKDAASGKLAGSGARQLADVAIVTGYKAYKAGMRFAEWSKAVIKEAGEEVRPHLRAAWDKINAMRGRDLDPAEATARVRDVVRQVDAIQARIEKLDDFYEEGDAQRDRGQKRLEAQGNKLIAPLYKELTAQAARNQANLDRITESISVLNDRLMDAPREKAGRLREQMKAAEGRQAQLEKLNDRLGKQIADLEERITFDETPEMSRALEAYDAAARKNDLKAIERAGAEVARLEDAARAKALGLDQGFSIGRQKNERPGQVMGSLFGGLQGGAGKKTDAPKPIDNRGTKALEAEFLSRGSKPLNAPAPKPAPTASEAKPAAQAPIAAKMRAADLRANAAEKAPRKARTPQTAEEYFAEQVAKSPYKDPTDTPLTESTNKEAREALRMAAEKVQRGKMADKQKERIISAADDLMMAGRLGDQKAVREARKALFDATRGLEDAGRAKTAAVRTWDAIKQATRITQTLAYGTDVSFAFRQAAPLSTNAANVLNTARAFRYAYDALGREAAGNRSILPGSKGAESVHDTLKAHPMYDLGQKAGLELTLFGKAEEVYADNIATKLPWIKRTEAANEAFLDYMRLQEFGKYVNRIEANKSLSGVAKADAVKQAAEIVNTLTGRTDLGDGKVKQIADAMNGIMAAPRLNVSRLQLVNPAWWTKQMKSNPQVARQLAGNVVGIGATWGSLLALGAATGAFKVVLSPEDKDFGKIVSGERRYDITGGMLPVVKLVYQAGKFGTALEDETRTGTEEDARERKRQQGKTVDRVKTYLRGRLGPLSSYAADLLIYGEDFQRRPVTPRGAVSPSDPNNLATRFLPPLGAKSAYESYKADGMKGVALTAPAEFVGVGARIYDEDKPGFLNKQSKVMGEAERLGVDFGAIRRRQGESDNLFKSRSDKTNQWFDEYGQKLINSSEYKSLDLEDQRKAIRNLKENVSREANQLRPNLRSFDPQIIVRGIRQGERRQERTRARMIYSEPE